MLRAALDRRPKAVELFATLNKHRELADDSIRKVRNGLVTLKRSSVFITFAIRRYKRCVRILQMMFRRALSISRLMRQRALQEWLRREETLWDAGYGSARRPPDHVRERVIAEEYAAQRKQFGAAWRVWYKTQLSLEAQYQEVAGELRDALQRPAAHAQAVKALQDRLGYLNGRLQHHDVLMPVFKGIQVNPQVLDARVAVVLKHEASERVHEAMRSLGVKTEDAAFLETVVKRYEAVLEAECASKRLELRRQKRKASSCAAAAGNFSEQPPLEKHASSLWFATSPVPQPPPVVLTSPRNGDRPARSSAKSVASGSFASQQNRVESTVPCSATSSREALPVDVDAAARATQLASFRTGGDVSDAFTRSPRKVRVFCGLSGDLAHSSMSLRRPQSAGAPVALDASSLAFSCGADGGSIAMSQSISILTPSNQRSYETSPRKLLPADDDLTVCHAPGVVQQSSSVAPLTAAQQECYTKLGIHCESLSAPVEAACDNGMFSKSLHNALRVSGLMHQQSPVQEAPEAEEVCHDVGSPVQHHHRKQNLVMKKFAFTPQRPQCPVPGLPSEPRLNRAADLRRGADERQRRRLFDTIGSRYLMSATRQALHCEHAANSSPSPRKAPTDTNLAQLRNDLRSAAREEAAAQHKAPIPLPPPLRLSDMRLPTPPPRPEERLLFVTSDDVSPQTPVVPETTVTLQSKNSTSTGALVKPAVPCVVPPTAAVQCGTMTITTAGTILVHGVKPSDYCSAHGMSASSPAHPGTAASRQSSTALPQLVPVVHMPRQTRTVNAIVMIRAWEDAASLPSASQDAIAIACSDQSFRIYSMVTQECVFIEKHPARRPITSLAVCGRFVCGACDDNSVYVYRRDISSCIGNLQHPVLESALPRKRSAASPCKPAAAASPAAQWSLHGVMTQPADVTFMLDYSEPMTKVEKRSNGSSALLLVSSFHHVVLLWDVQSMQVLHRLDSHVQGVGHILRSRATGSILTSSYDSTVRLWSITPPDSCHSPSCGDSQNGSTTRPPSQGLSTKAPRTITAQPSIVPAETWTSEFASTFSQGGFADVLGIAGHSEWELHTTAAHADNQLEDGPLSSFTSTVSVFTQHRGAVLCCGEVAGTRSIASISRDNTIRVWDQLTLEPVCVIHNIPGHLFIGWSMFPMQRSLAAVFADSSCRVFSTETGKLLSIVPLPSPPHATAKVHSSGLLAVGTAAGHVLIVSAVKGELAAHIEKVHTMGVSTLLHTAAAGNDVADDCSAHDDRSLGHLISGGEDRNVYVLQVPRAALDACV